MDKVEKLATPETAATVTVPERVPALGLVPMATVMLAVELGTALEKASWTVIWTAGAMEAPATAVVGWAVRASVAAAAGEMLKAAEVAGVSGAEAAVKV